MDLLLLSALLVYFWYFYFDFGSKPPPKPKTPAPAPPVRPQLKLEASTHSMFRLLLNNVEILKHTFSADLASTYWVHKADQKIMERDDCQPYTHPVQIPAKRFGLYRHLRENPDGILSTRFPENSPHVAFEKDVFYFECVDRRVGLLKMCDSGTYFQNHRCVGVTSCMGRPDGVSIPHPGDLAKFVVCSNGREFVRHCPPGHFFYLTRCVPETDLPHLCHFRPEAVVRLDERTLRECRRGRPVAVRCGPGTRVFENGTACEPDVCWGRADGDRLPLPERRSGPFRFWPGYFECRGGRPVAPPVECPRIWDHRLTKGDDTTSLPMVFDGVRCAVPSFCENVVSDDPDTVVPIHDFGKRVRNWKLSGIYDASAGYACEGPGRNAKRKLVTFEGDGRVDAKRFRVETACDDPSRHYLPVLDRPAEYYDCISRRLETCPANRYFDGDSCRERPTPGFPVFEHRGVPLFHFDSLNEEGWLRPWDYSSQKRVPCRAGYEYLRLYGVCSHVECEKYAFLSMVPELSVLLPGGRNAACVYRESERHLMLEDAADLADAYTFWDQRVWFGKDATRGDGPCTPGQTLATGHFVWDRTVYATCDYEQPFVFCPSSAASGILQVAEHLYACAPPPGNRLFHAFTTQQHGRNAWTPFATNEVKGIKPFLWDPAAKIRFNLNKRDPERELPEHGFRVPADTRFTFRVDEPVWLELRYRVTFPPNVAFEYDEATDDRKIVWDDDRGKGFHVRHRAFENLEMNFPRFRTQPHVYSFSDVYLH